MKIGFIGIGNMGMILIELFIELRVVDFLNMIIINCIIEKVLYIKNCYNSINVIENLEKFVFENEMIFICVKLFDIYFLFVRVLFYLRKDYIFILIISLV